MEFEFIEDEQVRAKAKAAYEESIRKVNEGIQAKIDEAVSGLRAKNEELLGEKKKIQEKLSQFADITDPQEAVKALKFLNESEEAQMIRDGRVDELIGKKTAQMKLDYENQLKEVTAKLEETANQATTYKTRYERKLIDDNLRDAAIRAGIRPEAIADVLLRGSQLFTLGKDGSLEARNEKGELRKNSEGSVITPAVWLEDLKTSAPHYWPSSDGVGASGSSFTADGDKMAKLADLAKKGDWAAYRKLRDQK
jgi:hypothetical protein